MKKSIIAILCLSLILGACASADKKTAKATGTTAQKEQSEQAEEKKYQPHLDLISPSAYGNVNGLRLEKGSYISVIGKADNTAFWKEVKRGVQAAADEINENLGYTGKDAIKITYNAPSEAENVDEQVNILDEELARYPIAVAIAITDTKACEVQFDLAAENNIPIVAFDSGSDYKGIQAMAATDNKMASEEAADRIAEAVGEKGNVVALIHDSKSETAKLRGDSFVKRMKKHKGIKFTTYKMDRAKEMIAEEVNAGTYSLSDTEPSGVELAEENKIKAADVTEENVLDFILAKNPGVNGMYGTNSEMVSAITNAVERHELNNVKIIGFDMDEKGREAVEEGKITSLVVQNPFGMGYASVVAAARAALNMGNEAEINTGYLWVTQKNVASDRVTEIVYGE